MERPHRKIDTREMPYEEIEKVPQVRQAAPANVAYLPASARTSRPASAAAAATTSPAPAFPTMTACSRTARASAFVRVRSRSRSSIGAISRAVNAAGTSANSWIRAATASAIVPSPRASARGLGLRTASSIAQTATRQRGSRGSRSW